MKKVTNNLYTIAILMTIIFLMPFRSEAMMKETEKVITKEASVTPSTLIKFENKLGKLVVKTWNQPKVRIETRIVIDGKDESVDNIINYISAIDFSKSSGEISFNTKFYKLYAESFGVTRIVLQNGDVIKGISKLKFYYTLTMPADNPVNIINKYEDVVIPDLNGKVNLELYESNLEAGNLNNELCMSLKYGDANIASAGQSVIKLYESEANIGSTNELNLDSKYSKFSSKHTGDVTFDCYEDHVEIAEHGSLKGKAKYSSLIFSDFESGKMELYETKVNTGDIGTLQVTAKYSNFEFNSVKDLVMPESYENKVICNKVGTFNSTSKYGDYIFYNKDTKLEMLSSYEDEIGIKKMSKSFEGILLNSKYTDLEIIFEDGTVYKIDANLKYTDLDYPAGSFDEIRYHKDGSDFQYEGIVKGGNRDTCPVIDLNMYEGKVDLQ